MVKLPSETVICEICGLRNELPEGQWYMNCKETDCGRMLLRNADISGKRYVGTDCKTKHWQFVDEEDSTIECAECKETRIHNGQKIYKSEKATGFLNRRMAELEEEKKKLEKAENQLTEMGKSIPVVKAKKVEINKFDSSTFLSKTVTVNCDDCGNAGKVVMGAYLHNCGWKKCTKMLCRPGKPGVKYVVAICCDSMGIRAVDEKCMFVALNCCKREHAIGTIASQVLNGQIIYATVPSSSFIKCLAQEIYDTRRKVEAANKKLSKMVEKPSFFQRLFQMTKDVTKKMTEK